MSWPLGYAKPPHRLHVSVDGTISVNEAVVTDTGGWMDVPLPATASVRGAPDAISIRIRVSADDDGCPFLYAEQVEVAGRRFAGVHALIMAEGAQWIGALSRSIFAEIERRVNGPVDATGPRPLPTRRDLPAQRQAPVQLKTADETWEPLHAKDRKASSER